MHYPIYATAAAALLFINVAVAEPKSELTLDLVLAAALSSSPVAADLDYKESTALADALSVSVKQNPELSTEIRERVGGTKGDTEYEVGLAQPIRPGDFGLRTRVRELLEQAARSDRGIAVVELSQQVKLLYAALWASTEQGRYFEETSKHALHLSQTIERGVSQGLLSKSEAQLFTAEAKRLEAELIGARGERRKSEAEMLRLTGLDGPLGSPLKPTWPALPPKSELLEWAKGELPVQRRVVLAANVSRLQAELARKGAWPSLVPRLAFEHTTEGQDRINVGFSVPLPFFDRNQPERMRTEAQKRATEAQKRFLMDGGFQEALALRYESAEDLVAQQGAYESSVIPLLKSALDALEKQYEAGHGSVLAVWQTQRELVDARQRNLDLWLKATAARLELATLTGREL